MMIHTDELDRSKGFFAQLRSMHPITIGSIVDGKRVIETCYQMRGNYNVAMYRLEGEREYREVTEQ